MALRFKLQLVVVATAGEPVSADDLVVLNQDHARLEPLGLTLAEAKALLLELQRQVRTRQLAAGRAWRTACLSGGRRRGPTDHQTVLCRTVFGTLELDSPRLRRCPCQHPGRASMRPLVALLPEHPAPELLDLESKWACLVASGLTVKARQDCWPVDARLNATSGRRDTIRIARRLEAGLGPEPVFPLAGCPSEGAHLPTPPAPLTVGLDGGYPAPLAAPADPLRRDRG